MTRAITYASAGDPADFAQGTAGAGLLIMRMATGVVLIAQALPVLLAGPPLGAALWQVFPIALGTLLFAGLWTPVAGTLVAIDSLWNVFVSGHHPWRWTLLAALGAALALIGPGAWSIDARLFGWRRVDIGDRKHRAPPTSQGPHR